MAVRLKNLFCWLDVGIFSFWAWLERCKTPVHIRTASQYKRGRENPSSEPDLLFNIGGRRCRRFFQTIKTSDGRGKKKKKPSRLFWNDGIQEQSGGIQTRRGGTKQLTNGSLFMQMGIIDVVRHLHTPAKTTLFFSLDFFFISNKSSLKRGGGMDKRILVFPSVGFFILFCQTVEENVYKNV